VTKPEVLARSWRENHVRVSVAERAGSQGRHQDGWIVTGLGAGLLLAVVDGAGVRVPLAGDEPQDSRELVDRVVQSFRSGAPSAAPLPGLWLESANDAIRDWLLGYPTYREMWPLLEARPRPLANALSELSEVTRARITDALAGALGGLDSLDTRHLRLLLPACVISAAFLDAASGRLEYAHLGDTVLARVTAGSVEQVTHDQMARFDGEVIREAVERVRSGLATDMADAAGSFEIQRVNLLNGVRHNFARPDGTLAPDEGCGVINGMRDMGAFVETGSLTLAAHETIVLMSDGMALPLHLAGAGESDGAAGRRSRMTDLASRWRLALARSEPAELVAALDAILDADADRTVLPRLKDRDDATAVIATTEAP